MTRFDFSGRRVLVTGAAQGIGRRIAEGFAEAGASLLLLDRQEQAVEALASELRNQGREARALAVDLADPAAIATALAGLDGLDVLVHNAAYFPLTEFAAITPQLLQRTLAVNLGALFWLTQAALPLFAARGGGCVLATSSVTGNRVAYPGLSHYAASKAGVNGFIRNAALELAPRNIRVNGVEPGMIHTPAMANLGDAALEARIAAGIPLGRLGQPADIAGAMLFLASDAAAYITGQTLVVDGGATLPESSAALV
ncbi:3-oxoacyl-[acyl-carrier protein] reductase [Pseudomonas citronellolis]|uniref:SDR family oxidoreductase n=1 Tax=Pseudomonas citronellolis TaxID=53408 RepID=UPI0020A001F0|nr:SDR family oxidoreductase [Pseudomonas citronellolis]MCP1643688.1 3-oxoacyl-[acyl-carrier protein] reductase [Pseudomonas citronellolis]MCP1666613.1 3-oxoacyl-[acyl-carrier protein] reductase [Pseudomonas citronellolis]MCP1697177.1 3-oxoacyl-[acyl-carrier protein] reductase [Pseudomonas citronellolis]MCP1704152.1 3-oxoacyl-[acyl-carrier protein] reductase [Pseudomonas citronellolis]MCP1798303.1 3-oxoacyl-[acyl-carrier protein] reductase [Pseudomonas citronellolis]